MKIFKATAGILKFHSNGEGVFISSFHKFSNLVKNAPFSQFLPNIGYFKTMFPVYLQDLSKLPG